MSIKEAEGKIAALEAELHTLAPMDPHAEELRTTIATLREEAMRNMDSCTVSGFSGAAWRSCLWG